MSVTMTTQDAKTQNEEVPILGPANRMNIYIYIYIYVKSCWQSSRCHVGFLNLIFISLESYLPSTIQKTIHGTGIFTYIYQKKNQLNVGKLKYTSPMDPMGYCIDHFVSWLPHRPGSQQLFWESGCSCPDGQAVGNSPRVSYWDGKPHF